MAIPAPLVTRSEMLGPVFRLSWATDVDATGWLEVTGPDRTWTTPPLAQAATHEQTLLGLKASGSYSVRAMGAADGVTFVSAPVTIEVPDAPDAVRRLSIEQFDPAQTHRPYFFVMSYVLGLDFAVIYDQDGDPVWWFRTGTKVNALRPSLDGKSILMYLDSLTMGEDAIIRVPLGAMSPDEVVRTAIADSHHDFTELPDHRLAYLTKGRQLMDWGPWGRTPVILAVVHEVEEGATDAETARVVYDPRLTYPDPIEYLCQHQDPDPVHADWDHVNSLLYIPTEDAFILNQRDLDTLVKVDRATGAVLWQMGGRHTDFTLPSAAEWVDHGHMSQWSGNRFAIFSNGLHHGESHARLFSVDEVGRAVHLLWDVPEPENRLVSVLGDVDELPNGNVLVDWAEGGLFEEYTAGGELVWRARTTHQNQPRLWYFADLYDVSDPSAVAH